VIEPGRVQRLLPEVEVQQLQAGAHVA
jgi:hypothetical protein